MLALLQRDVLDNELKLPHSPPQQDLITRDYFFLIVTSISNNKQHTNDQTTSNSRLILNPLPWRVNWFPQELWGPLIVDFSTDPNKQTRFGKSLIHSTYNTILQVYLRSHSSVQGFFPSTMEIRRSELHQSKTPSRISRIDPSTLYIYQTTSLGNALVSSYESMAQIES